MPSLQLRAHSEVKVKCPECGSENVQSKLSFTNIVSWVRKLLGTTTVKIFEKRYAHLIYIKYKRIVDPELASLTGMTEKLASESRYKQLN
jgi:hypothetical protein